MSEGVCIMEVNEILKERRIELNMTMLDVAKKVGVSEGTISRWESGDIANMKRDKIAALAKALSISPGVIMEWEELPAIHLTRDEENLIQKYRENPQMHDAIHRLLGIE